MTIKRIIIRIFFTVELFIFSWIYLYSTHGLTHLLALHQENRDLCQEVTAQLQLVTLLEKDITQWNQDSFYKEKIDREKLQMAGRHEEIYAVL